MFVTLQWYHVHNAIDRLANDIRKRVNQACPIYGIPRGGLIPAVMLSHELDFPLITTAEQLQRAGSNVIVTDDVCYTGDTLRRSEYAKASICAVLYSKGNPLIRGMSNVMAGMVTEATDNRQILFPWEHMQQENASILQFRQR